MKTIPSLDPEYKKATQRLNRYFAESIFDIRLLPHEDLLWYLSTVLLWKESDNEDIARLKDDLER